MHVRMKSWGMIGTAVLLTACVAVSPPGSVETPKVAQYPPVHVNSRATPRSQADTIAFFEIDTRQPFHIEFGRGSGWHGLDVIIVDQTGHVTMSRQPIRAGEVWTKGELSLPADLLVEIIAGVNSEKLTGLDKAYLGNVADGTQWLFYISQGANQKVVYFDNNFPGAITRFAKHLDDILDRGGMDKVTWSPGGEEMNKALWKRMEQPK
jgi:hypothetical protein